MYFELNILPYFSFLYSLPFLMAAETILKFDSILRYMHVNICITTNFEFIKDNLYEMFNMKCKISIWYICM